MDTGKCSSCCIIIKNLCVEPKSQEKEDMIISRDELKNILSYIDFLRLSYVITQFP